MTAQTGTPLPPITVRVREAWRITGIGRSKSYERISAGEIKTIKVGSMTLIPVNCIHIFMEARRCSRDVK